MRLTRSVGYAVGILLQIDDARQEAPVTAATIAKGCKFPPRFLYRVLRRLVAAKLLIGTSGPAGGYTLAKRPTKISLLDIVKAVDASPTASELLPVRLKYRKSMAVVNRVCQSNAQRFAHELSRITLADLRPVKRKSRPTTS